MPISILRGIKFGRKKLLEWDEKFTRLKTGLEKVVKILKTLTLTS